MRGEKEKKRIFAGAGKKKLYRLLFWLDKKGKDAAGNCSGQWPVTPKKKQKSRLRVCSFGIGTMTPIGAGLSQSNKGNGGCAKGGGAAARMSASQTSVEKEEADHERGINQKYQRDRWDAPARGRHGTKQILLTRHMVRCCRQWPRGGGEVGVRRGSWNQGWRGG